MNYRHAYHAGNFADVMKHALLTRLLAYLSLKPAPFRAIDTHAGVGLYDLAADEARRTGEAAGGVERLAEPLDNEAEALLAPYRAVIASVRARYGETVYPGSPAILREMLRPQDRGILVELHPADGAVLTERFNAVTQLKVMRQDGWTALHALIPPRERRGIVLIDPPFEEAGEHERLVRELVKAVRKWPTGVFAAWYPVKDLASVERALAGLADLPRPGLRLELYVERPDDPTRLTGCGLVVVNPPYTFAGEAEVILRALAGRLSRGAYGAYRVDPVGAPAA